MEFDYVFPISARMVYFLRYVVLTLGKEGAEAFRTSTPNNKQKLCTGSKDTQDDQTALPISFRLTMSKTLITSLALIASLATALIPHTTGIAHGQVLTNQQPAPKPPIKVTINPVHDFLGLATDHFHVGEQILVTISMTNTSTSPVAVCNSADLYQDLPTLTTNGVPVQIMNWQTSVRRIVARDQTCEQLNRPETIKLNPNEPKVVDSLVLVDSKVSTGADAWYDSLPPGKYELSIQRQLGCCDGPKVQSNKIGFEVVP